MPALFVFLLKVNIALLLFCAGYYLVLRHLTFYTLNRVYLVAAILFATVYPQINLNSFAERHQQIAQPVQQVMVNFQTKAEILAKPLAQPIYWTWITAAFWLGVAILALRLLMQLYSLYKLHKTSVPMNIRDHKVRVVLGNTSPFSFWQSIYLNPANHSTSDLKAILQHEQIHVNDWHTLDVLLAEISTIFYWFNPGIWLMKKAVKENIEFITDRKILNSGADSKAYQYSLVNVSFAVAPHNIVNHFNISTIKKRIIMINAKKSSKYKLTRYALVMPVVILCLLTFSFSRAELIKKSQSTYKDITISVDNIIKLIPTKPFGTPAKKDTLRKTIKRVMIDTIRISRTGLKDSVQIIKRDMPVSVDGFKIANFDNHYTFKMDTDVKLKNYSNFKILQDDTNKKNTFYMVNGNPHVITIVRINGRNINPANLTTLNGRTVAIDTVRINGRAKTVNGHIILDTIMIPAANLTFDNQVFLRRGQRMQPNEEKRNLTEVIAMGYPVNDSVRKGVLLRKMQGFSVSSDGEVTHDGSSRGGHGPTKLMNIIVPYAGERETNIDHISEKLIFIDGKEATAKEFKKLSAGDIESMNTKSGASVVREYGEKAKFGVLMITTKKGK